MFFYLKIILLITLFSFQTCVTTKPIKETERKYFIVRFTEAMDSISVLNKANYHVRNSSNDTIKIKEVLFLKSFIDTSIHFEKHSIVILIPVAPVYAKSYQIEIRNVKDKAGFILNPNPTKVFMK